MPHESLSSFFLSSHYTTTSYGLGHHNDYRPRAIPSRVVLRARLAQLECDLSAIPRDRTLRDMVADKTLVVLGDLILATEDLGKGVEQYAEVHHIRAAIHTRGNETEKSTAHKGNSAAASAAAASAAAASAAAASALCQLNVSRSDCNDSGAGMISNSGLMAETNPRVVRFRSRALSTCALTRSKRLLLGGVCADGCLVDGEDDVDEEEDDGETAATAAAADDDDDDGDPPAAAAATAAAVSW
ncbi:hypothetical protein B0O80DRAFT_518844 [Mortierella sp. GBAus27b]|nr:hypothetical protein B0O80DRAFT_518844 [Mortierella sp. GBAus27b]